MISALSLTDRAGAAVDLLDDAQGRTCLSLSGLVGTAAVRSSRRVKPTRRGGINPRAYTDGATMAGEFEASGATVEAAFSTFRQMVKPMRESVFSTLPATLKWTEGTSGLALQRKVRLVSETDPILKDNAALLAWQAQFFSEDDRAFSQTQNTFTGAALSALGGGLTFNSAGESAGGLTFPFTFSTSGGGTLAITNAGSDDSPPVWRIYGEITNAQLVNLANPAERLVFTGSVAANDYIEVDVSERTVRLNGDATQELPNLVSSALSTWFEIPAATAAAPTTNVQLIADSFDGVARVDCLLRNAY